MLLLLLLLLLLVLVLKLVLAARPIGEPVVQYGPFVMNSEGEIEQALRDYRDGVLAV